MKTLDDAAIPTWFRLLGLLLPFLLGRAVSDYTTSMEGTPFYLRSMVSMSYYGKGFHRFIKEEITWMSRKSEKTHGPLTYSILGR